MRMRGVDHRSAGPKRPVHGLRERTGLFARNADVHGVEQDEIGDVGAQVHGIGPQPRAGPADGRLAIDEGGDCGDRPVGAGEAGEIAGGRSAGSGRVGSGPGARNVRSIASGGTSLVAEHPEGERFHRTIRGRLHGMASAREQPVECMEIESVDERMHRVRVIRANAAETEQARHEHGDVDRRLGSHGPAVRYRDSRRTRAAEQRNSLVGRVWLYNASVDKQILVCFLREGAVYQALEICPAYLTLPRHCGD